ncbi:hypothetical protein EB118_08680 [bacterium]|nr:hypothetical protein [bacterium]NBX98597.1 hypothetical protein [bacterium]NDC94690.1 hypothetical protein [bacterium]NDD84220.1 hypothetical protein [bacterium]NDG30137.1 hypothetical protein [bacterium]
MYNPFYFSTVIAYMLQNTEYQIRPYLTWYIRLKNIKKVMYRRKLEPTRAAKALRLFVLLGVSTQMIVSIILFVTLLGASWIGPFLAAILYFTAPTVWALLVVVPLWFGRVIISNPKEKRLIKASALLFKKHPAHKIVVAGSYGKTSMKELLGSVLSTEKKVAITPANKNVALSHALFARRLKGDEDILVIELGEGKNGDVKRFCETIGPDTVFITGIAPAHLDQYVSLDQAATDIFSATNFVSPSSVYVNTENQYTAVYIKEGYIQYNAAGASEAKASKVKQSLNGVSFHIKTPKASYEVQAPLLGKHLVGPLCAAVQLAERFSITKQSILQALAGLQPYEHRMQPRYLASGAYLIDDTYNGNIEGMKAGLALLNDLPAKRRIYVTPGLVDQGSETHAVHTQLGAAIAASAVDVVVLMNNSAQPIIQAALSAANYSGELRVEDDPLYFYTHIEDITAAGDVVLLQNDWPDNYA